MGKKYNYIPESFINDINKNYKELCIKYNISPQTVYRWKFAIKNKEYWKINSDIKINSRILGVLWALGRDDGKNFILRYKNKDIIEEVKTYFKLNNNIIVGKSNTNIQYKLKITGNNRIKILNILKQYGWTERNADIREYPKGNIDHKIFIQTYIEIHSCLDFPFNNRIRLRVFGNKFLIYDINKLIPQIFNVKSKTPQKITDKTYALYYADYYEIKELYTKVDIKKIKGG